MVHFLRRRPPQIADVQCSRLKFEPGDRIIVRAYTKLDKDQKRKLERSVKRFAGCDVEVYIVPCMEYDLEVVKSRDILQGRPQG